MLRCMCKSFCLCVACEWNDLDRVRVTRLSIIRGKRITMRKQLFAARCNPVTPVSRCFAPVCREWNERGGIYSRAWPVISTLMWRVARLTSPPVLGVENAARLPFPPPANRRPAPSPPRRDWSRDDRNKRVSSLRGQTHPAFTSIVTLRPEVSEELPLHQQQMPFGQSSSFRARVGFLG